MTHKKISILVGILCILATASLVYMKKKPTMIYVETPVVEKVVENTIATTTTVSSASASNTTPVVKSTPSKILTLADVSTHGTRTSCWSVINGEVFDLTGFIPNHPGGEEKILSLCGIDGSAAYNAQHGGDKKPARILAGFKIATFTK